MLTGFDLYHTIRSLLLDRSAASFEDEIGIPDWSFDILAKEIPKNRTCEEAKVDPELCRRQRVAREYGVCNYLDPEQKRFCSLKRHRNPEP